MLSPLFYSWENWGSETESDLCDGEAETQNQSSPAPKSLFFFFLSAQCPDLLIFAGMESWLYFQAPKFSARPRSPSPHPPRCRRLSELIRSYRRVLGEDVTLSPEVTSNAAISWFLSEQGVPFLPFGIRTRSYCKLTWKEARPHGSLSAYEGREPLLAPKGPEFNPW